MFKQLKYNSDKNKVNVEFKKPYTINTKATNEFLSKSKLVYESDWQVCELEQFNEATSTTKGTLLPEKAKYDFTFELGIPESYLPFITWNVIAKTVPEQKIEGVGAFIFTSLREILLDVYQWKGVTQLSTYAGIDSEYLVILPRSEPLRTTLNGYTNQITDPQPLSAYTHTTQVNYVTPFNNSDFTAPVKIVNGEYFVYEDITPTYPTNPTWVTYYDYTSWLTTWIYYSPDNGTTMEWTYSEVVSFTPDTWLYPPSDDDSISWEFPNGTTDDINKDSTVDYPNQYWDKKHPLKTFSWFLSTDGAEWGYPGGATTEDKYDYVYDIFKEWYPGEKSLITSFAGGPPYHAYRPIEENVIVTANQQEIINNLNPIKNNLFRFDIKGHFLLLSEANTEADYSDADNPTYIPSGEDIMVKIKVFYDSKLNTKSINKWDI